MRIMYSGVACSSYLVLRLAMIGSAGARGDDPSEARHGTDAEARALLEVAEQAGGGLEGGRSGESESE